MDGLHRVEALIHPENQGSVRLIQRIGFQAEGLQRDVVWCEDRPMSLTMWSLLRSDAAAPHPLSSLDSA
jgi:ribosomal-protein-alanine N-acetyltransferase